MKYLETFRSRWREWLILTLVTLNILVWIAVWQREPDGKLRVYFLDIGQGDAILIDSPTHQRVLIDGGRNRAVLSELGKILPFADRKIDVVIATHPDADHIGGLPEVISRYEVGLFMKPGVESENTVDDELEKRVASKDIDELLARRGMILELGEGARLIILFPNQDVSNWETNRASIVARLEYGKDSFLLTGDSPIEIENVLMRLDEKILNVDVLKAGHHGSRTSTSLAFAEATSPEYSIISAGRDNTYGHPHKEVLDILNKVHSQILSTIDLGTVKFETDGQTLKLK